MVNKFCPKCGKPLSSGDLCSDCTSETLEYTPPLIQVSEFDRTFYKGSWHHFHDIEEVIKSRVIEALGKEVEIHIPPFEFTPQPKEKTKLQVFAIIDGEEIPLEVKLSYMQCDYGQKQKTTYFEGIMQLRDPHEQVFSFIDKEMKLLAPKGVFITKTVEQKNGVDLYFTNKTQMQLLGQKISSKFGASMSAHPQLFSHNHQTSKDIYRLNILVTLPPCVSKDVITCSYPRKGELLVQIRSMGKIMQGVDLLTGKTVGLELKNCTDLKVLPKQMTTISSIHPSVGVLDPETFQEEPLKNSSHHPFELGQKISVIKSSQGLFFVE
ncbi:MAG: hypothetical protein KC535_00715 [Nanoarchaeota archaeon]|nr:hypothetical protein [Nanoarchaeota archaeon]